MYGHGKCPKCEALVSRFDFEQAVIGDRVLGPFFHGISICCPQCKTVLGASIDPAALAADIAARVVERLQRKTK